MTKSGADTIDFPDDMPDWGEIGVGADNVTDAQARFIGLSAPVGLYISKVWTGWPGDKAGLKTGEAITEYDGIPIAHADDFWDMIDARTGQRISLTIEGKRGKRTVDLPVVALKEMAIQGNGKAHFLIAFNYRWGRDVAQDYKQVFAWARKGVVLGDTDCMVWLARLYYEGKGVTQDYKKAFVWAKKGAELGNTSCMSWLSIFYYHGVGVTRNHSQAKYWLRKGTALGNMRTKGNLKAWFGE